jgi:hypothetical protein
MLHQKSSTLEAPSSTKKAPKRRNHNICKAILDFKYSVLTNDVDSFNFVHTRLQTELHSRTTLGFQLMMGFVSEDVPRGLDPFSITEHMRASKVHQNITQLMVFIILS